MITKKLKYQLLAITDPIAEVRNEKQMRWMMHYNKRQELLKEFGATSKELLAFDKACSRKVVYDYDTKTHKRTKRVEGGLW